MYVDSCACAYVYMVVSVNIIIKTVDDTNLNSISSFDVYVHKYILSMFSKVLLHTKQFGYACVQIKMASEQVCYI